ncbi:hypothetical protein LLG10_06460 [bacterium]|nr:hypothetical protein [bacterium]
MIHIHKIYVFFALLISFGFLTSQYINSSAIQIPSNGNSISKEEDKVELPDRMNANLWFSNSVQGQSTNMLIHIPLEINDLCCFEIMLKVPIDMLDMSKYFTQEALKNKETRDFISEHLFINGKALKESTNNVAIIGLKDGGKRFFLQVVPIEKNIKELNILFDKSLEITFKKEGRLHIDSSRVFIGSSEVKYGGKDVWLEFPDNYIFPNI